MLCKELSQAQESDFDTFVVRDSVKRWSHRHTIAYVDVHGNPIMEPVVVRDSVKRWSHRHTIAYVDVHGNPIMEPVVDAIPLDIDGEHQEEGKPILVPKEISNWSGRSSLVSTI